ncbi:histone-fold-containing protein [Scheffersomyces coipomensis]|uniref:histone-fold-containing protein n=1 Tax=Scheffersomyces coipomensis TaxID=1788519 RepID=UPI00315D1B65
MSNLNQLINKEDDYSYVYNPATNGSTTTVTNNTTEVPEETSSSNGLELTQDNILTSFEKIKTHFPAARIKKIMQSDDEIGKVAQATPIIVGRALEIFMANLVEVSIIEAKKQGVKRITASHIRAAIENTEQFDFLVEAVEKYPPLKN